MLKHLSIKNYALIDHLELDFHNGFSVITGETGAGKSIMLSALSLILGKRADLKSIKAQEIKCVVEGSFELSEKLYEDFFKKNDLDFENLSILRREISVSGKSRAFINDTPVTIDVLAVLAERLIDVHSQHQNLLLNNINFQLQLLDDFAGNHKLLSLYQSNYEKFKNLKQELALLQDVAQNEVGDSDYLQFLFEELQSAQLIVGEQEDIEQELKLVQNATEIQSNLSESVRLIDEQENSLISNLSSLENHLSVLKNFDSDIVDLYNRIHSSKIDLDDVLSELKEKLANSEVEPNRLEILDSRLSLLISLQRKHQCADGNELIEKRETLDSRIQELSGLEDSIKKKEEEIGKAKDELILKAEQLTSSRKKLIPNLEKQIITILKSLNFASATFKISLESNEEFTAKGSDKIDFLFSANPGQEANKLAKVASGGELSRVMLALKAIMAKTQNLPAIIFDEIDTGVSGETAGKIGEILKVMGAQMQVIAISHLPQIASMGKFHYKVEKDIVKNLTRTHIYQLNEEERISELARLLSGEKISDAALVNAKELLKLS